MYGRKVCIQYFIDAKTLAGQMNCWFHKTIIFYKNTCKIHTDDNFSSFETGYKVMLEKEKN